jgi:hypothetical protein
VTEPRQKRQQLQVWLPDDIANQVRELAESLGVSLSAAVGILVRRGLNATKDEK